MNKYVIYQLQAMGKKEMGLCLASEFAGRIESCSEIGISINKVGSVQAESKTMAMIEFNKTNKFNTI